MRQPEPRFWSGRRVCVTGGTGFLGLHLVRQLLSLGAEVRVHALPPPPDHAIVRQNAVLHTGDIRDEDSVRQAVAGCSIVFHTAGPVGVSPRVSPLMREVHESGTRNVLRALEPGSRLVQTSSVVAVGAALGGKPVTEDDPFNLDGVRLPYVHAKRAAEEMVLSAARSGADALAVNPGYLVGPDDPGRSVMGSLCVRFWRGRMPLAMPGGFNLADVRDVAAGHLLAAEHGEAGRRYLLGGENHTFANLLRLLADVASLRPRALPQMGIVGLSLFALLAEARAKLFGKEAYPCFGHVRLNRFLWYCDSSRGTARELGFIPRPVRQSLADAHAWHREHAGLPLRGLARWWMRPCAA